ncbi:MAG: CvpA family protein [Tannerella sp.]|jgi:membrane protein required for colicin V production|nr:CvpA family protein [Tannerella sp.]
MNWLDIAIAAWIIIAAVKGYTDGFIRQIVMLIALVAAIYLCSAVAVYFRTFIHETGWLPEQGVTVVSYVLAFVLIVTVITAVGNVLHKVMDVTPLSLLNHLAGCIFASAFAVLLISLTLNIVDYSDRDSVLIPQDVKSKSRLYRPLQRVIPVVYIGNLFEIA